MSDELENKKVTQAAPVSPRQEGTDWDKVHALLEPWREVWKGDRAKFAEQYPKWMLDAATELFAHDLCDAWAWNEYVSAAATIIARHFADSVTLTPPNSAKETK